MRHYMVKLDCGDGRLKPGFHMICKIGDGLQHGQRPSAIDELPTPH